MADFYGALSSTAFRVKDREAFLADPAVAAAKEYATSEGGFFEEEEGYFSFAWHGQYPSWIIQQWDETGEDLHEHDLALAIVDHILPGDVCKIAIGGSEKLRYINGVAAYITSRGVVYYDETVQWSYRLTEGVMKQEVGVFHDSILAILNPEANDGNA